MGNNISGRIFNIQRCCSADGPGIRTTVFFQGCPLHCLWCHNPESRSFGPQVSFRQESCLNCGKCRKMEPGTNCRKDPLKICSGCGICVDECPGGALALLGKKVTVDEVMETVRRDGFYYRLSGGGITLSGGEPLAQPEFAGALLEAAGTENYHTAVETSGAVPWESFESVLPWCDLWLFDIKAAPARYKELTGANYDLVKSNLLRLSAAGKEVILRVPLIAGGNCEAAFLAELEELVRLPGVKNADILPYHDFGRGKSTMCGKKEPEWERFSVPSPDTVKLYREKLN